MSLPESSPDSSSGAILTQHFAPHDGHLKSVPSDSESSCESPLSAASADPWLGGIGAPFMPLGGFGTPTPIMIPTPGFLGGNAIYFVSMRYLFLPNFRSAIESMCSSVDL